MHPKRKILFLIGFLFRISVCAQNGIVIKGKILTVDRSESISSANIILYQQENNAKYQAIAFAVSDSKGEFTMRINSTAQLFRITTSHILYNSDTSNINLTNSNQEIQTTVFLSRKSETLKEVIVKNTDIRVSGDTIEYTASAFKKIDTRKVEDLLKNIEGFSISSSGKITYRGKEIKAVLINGENLTKEQYQILTRNLNADIVEKVQVFDNFNENRIVGSVMKSGEAAINLDLKKELEGKLSGGIAAGSTLKDQHEIDGNLIWIRGRLKLINILNYNSIAKEGFKEANTGFSAIYSNSEQSFTANFYKGSGVIFPPALSLPSVSKTYLNRNNDFVFAPLLHFKINKVFKLALRYSTLYQLDRYSAGSLINTFINAQNEWQTFNARDLHRSETFNYLTLTLSHDSQKKYAGELFLQLASSINRYNYLNLTSGAITDTLNEYFKLGKKGISIQYNGAIKLNQFNALTITGSYNNLYETDGIDAITNRYNKYWHLQDIAHLLNQNTRFLLDNILARTSLLHQKGKTSLGLSLNQAYQNLKNRYNIITASEKGVPNMNDVVAFLPNKPNLQKFSTTIGGSIFQQFTPRITGRLSASTGLEKIVTTGVSGIGNNIIAWDILGGMRWKFKSFSSLTTSLSSVKILPPLNYFIPGSFLQSNGGLFFGSTTLKPIQYSKAEINYNTYRLLTSSSFQVNVSAKRSATDYIFGSTIDTSLIIMFPIPVTGNWEYVFTVSGRTYIFPIKSTVGATVYFRKDNGKTVVNSVQTDNNQTNSFFTLTYLSKFNFPLNTEISYSKNFFNNKQGTGLSEITTKTNWNYLVCKARLQFNERYYFGAEYNYLQFQDQKSIHLFDFYSAYIFSKRLSVDGKIHNLFNINRFQQVTATPNSTSYQSMSAIGRYFFIRLNLSF